MALEAASRRPLDGRKSVFEMMPRDGPWRSRRSVETTRRRPRNGLAAGVETVPLDVPPDFSGLAQDRLETASRLPKREGPKRGSEEAAPASRRSSRRAHQGPEAALEMASPETVPRRSSRDGSKTVSNRPSIDAPGGPLRPFGFRAALGAGAAAWLAVAGRVGKHLTSKV
ncbi:hypothetical protein M885DRAFT_80968 [Pelagophyceae sp. CCMP2097]|nr:hypothetical protein M885DRAFT_80968 [Pelagophyceae sp. CCMP2097]